MYLTLTVLSFAIVMIIAELLSPGRNWKQVSGWWSRAILLNMAQVGAVFLAGLTIDKWFSGISFWHADKVFGVTIGALVGYFVLTFIYYWWHRLRHQNQFFWRWFHQIHHSAQRIEIITSFYKHPIEILTNSVISAFIFYVLMGLGPESAAIATLLTGVAELFYHWNVKTPRWIGYIIQRPESHCVHHKLGWHTQNFSDLPLWDIMFGTFYNPTEKEFECGFKENREVYLKEMLVGQDVNPRS